MLSEYRSMVLFALVFGRDRNEIVLFVAPTMIIPVGDGLKTSARIQSKCLLAENLIFLCSLNNTDF